VVEVISARTVTSVWTVTTNVHVPVKRGYRGYDVDSMRTDFLAEDSVCQLCGHEIEIISERYCTNCLEAMKPIMTAIRLPYDGSLLNALALWARMKTIQWMPFWSVILTEVALTAILRHPVFLPTPIGIEMVEVSTNIAIKLNEHKSVRFVKQMVGSLVRH
jgi:hypothetical protein